GEPGDHRELILDGSKRCKLFAERPRRSRSCHRRVPPRREDPVSEKPQHEALRKRAALCGISGSAVVEHRGEPGQWDRHGCSGGSQAPQHRAAVQAHQGVSLGGAANRKRSLVTKVRTKSENRCCDWSNWCSSSAIQSSPPDSSFSPIAYR